MQPHNSDAQSSFWRDAKRFLEPLKYARTEMIKNIIDALWQNSFGYIWVFFTAWLVHALEIKDREQYIFAVSLFGIAIVLYWLIRCIMWKWGFVCFRRKVYPILKQHYGVRFLTLDNARAEVIGTGHLQSITEKGINAQVDILLRTLRMWATLVAGVIATTAYLLYTDARFLLALAVLLPITLFVGRVMFARSRSAKRKKIVLVHDENRHFVKMLMSRFEVLQNQKVDSEVGTWKSFNERSYPLNSTVEFYSRIGVMASNVGTDAIRIGLYFVFGFLVLAGQWSIALVVTIHGLMSMIDRSISALSELIEVYNQEFVHVHKLWDTFDSTPAIRGYDEGTLFVAKGGGIRFENVSFSYGESQVLSGLSLALQRGKKTALVGASGGGKTTIMKLIAGYLHPTAGSVVVDDQKLEEIALKTYYPHIGYLTQEPSVFDGSIRENLLYGAKDGTSDEDMFSAIEKAQCQFVHDFEKGIDTEIWEKGIRLSGGQRQRLAIAKVFLKNPEIILLDEPTSALDSFSEERITQALNELFKWRTVVVIAHRLQTVRHADEILVIEWGEVVERGTHASLSSHPNWIYSRMLELQAGI